MIANSDNLNVFIDIMDMLINKYLVYEKYEFYPLSIINQFNSTLKVEPRGNNPYLFFSIAYHSTFPQTYNGDLYILLDHKRSMIDLSKWSFEMLEQHLKKGKEYGTRYKRIKRSFKLLDKEIRESNYQYFMTVNENVPETLESIREYQTKNKGKTWVTRALEETLIKLSKNPLFYKGTIGTALTWNLVRVNTETKEREVVFMDMGYQVGSIYTSMSGAYNKKYNGFGNLGLIMLNRLLEEWGFSYWDIGMCMKYKTELGSKNIDRKDMINIYKENRGKTSIAKEETDLSKNQSFNKIIEFVNKGEVRQKKEKQEIKAKRRLTKEEKKRLKDKDLKQQDPIFINHIIEKRFGQNIGYKGEVDLFDFISKSDCSKKLRKRIIKLFTVILNK